LKPRGRAGTTSAARYCKRAENTERSALRYKKNKRPTEKLRGRFKAKLRAGKENHRGRGSSYGGEWKDSEG